MALRWDKIICGFLTSLTMFFVLNLFLDIEGIPPMMGGICVIGILATGLMAGLKFQ